MTAFNGLSCAHPIAEMARWLECDACSTYNSQRTTFHIRHTMWFKSQGWLAGSSSTLAPGAVLPTIAIVAHHDSYGAAPVRISSQCGHFRVCEHMRASDRHATEHRLTVRLGTRGSQTGLTRMGRAWLHCSRSPASFRSCTTGRAHRLLIVPSAAS